MIKKADAVCTTHVSVPCVFFVSACRLPCALRWSQGSLKHANGSLSAMALSSRDMDPLPTPNAPVAGRWRHLSTLLDAGVRMRCSPPKRYTTSFLDLSSNPKPCVCISVQVVLFFLVFSRHRPADLSCSSSSLCWSLSGAYDSAFKHARSSGASQVSMMPSSCSNLSQSTTDPSIMWVCACVCVTIDEARPRMVFPLNLA